MLTHMPRAAYQQLMPEPKPEAMLWWMLPRSKNPTPQICTPLVCPTDPDSVTQKSDSTRCHNRRVPTLLERIQQLHRTQFGRTLETLPHPSIRISCFAVCHFVIVCELWGLTNLPEQEVAVVPIEAEVLSVVSSAIHKTGI